jgi:hypothetical protein
MVLPKAIIHKIVRTYLITVKKTFRSATGIIKLGGQLKKKEKKVNKLRS